MARKRNDDPSGQSWATFLRNHAPQTAAMDLFVVPTIGFDVLYALVIVRLARRELVWVNVTAHPTAEWIARQITEAFPWNEAPRYPIRDRDGMYGNVVRRRLRAMGIRDKAILRRRETVIAMSHQNVSARTKAKQPRTIAYLCYQTRFFTSHFLPAVRAAQANGFKVFALLPTLPPADQMPADVEVFLIRVVRSNSPELRLLPETLSVSSALQRCRPDIVQAVALQACVVLFLASALFRFHTRYLKSPVLGLSTSIPIGRCR